MHNVSERALPKRIVARTHGHEKLRKKAEAVFRENIELIEAVQSGRLEDAQKLIDDDDSLTMRHISLAQRWIRLERHYRFIL